MRSPAINAPVLTKIGTLLLAVLLLPNWPLRLYPQAATVPSEATAVLWLEPGQSATTVLPASTPDRFTNTGSRLSVVALLPNWPNILKPQAARVPSVQIERL